VEYLRSSISYLQSSATGVRILRVRTGQREGPARWCGAYDGQVSRDESFTATREGLSRTLRDALAETESVSDSETAYRQASWLVDVLTAASTASAQLRAAAARRMKDEEGLSIAQLGERLGVSKARAQDILGRTAVRPPGPPTGAVALVTSRLGVLAARRNDQTAPWAFMAAQMQPGESPGDAAANEVMERTGLEVTAGRIVTRDGGTVYLAARPVSPEQLEIRTSDSAELAEVRWLPLDEVERLILGMPAPVRAYLGRALRPRHPLS
jgi:8-oxo-dGTP pyrophosphatase MutT (NUDIX family)